MGGAEAFLVNLLTHLSSDEFEHHVIYFRHGLHASRIEQLGIKTYQINGLVTLYDPIFFIRLVRLLKSICPDLMHTVLLMAHIVGRISSKIMRIPVVSAFHSHAEVESDTSPIKRMVQRVTNSWSDQIVTVSSSIAHDIIANDPFCDRRNIHVIHNGIDQDALYQGARKRQISRTEIGFSDSDFIIGTVGRFILIKNQQMLLDSFAILAESNAHVKLVLVGYGPLEMALRDHARILAIEEKVLFVVGQSAEGWYPLFDCFVLPSQSEGLSIALLEAMAFELPVVVTGHDGGHEVVVTGKNGLVVEVDRDEIANAIQHVMSQKSLKKLMAKEAKNDIGERFLIQKTANKYLKLFQQVINEYNPRKPAKKI